MDDATAAIVRLSAAVATGDEDHMALRMDEALALADRVQVEEALLQSYLFLGFPAALNAFLLWRERAGPVAGGVSPDREAELLRMGEATCARVYSDRFDRLLTHVRELHPDLARWMIAEGYGKVLSRPGLPLVARELCIVAILAVTGARRQLYAHLRGALNVGATEEDVSAALALARDAWGGEQREEVDVIWAEVRRRMKLAEADGGA